MVEEGASERFDEISIEGRDSISREDLLEYIRSNFDGLSLKNIESLQEIIIIIFYSLYKIKSRHTLEMLQKHGEQSN